MYKDSCPQRTAVWACSKEERIPCWPSAMKQFSVGQKEGIEFSCRLYEVNLSWTHGNFWISFPEPQHNNSTLRIFINHWAWIPLKQWLAYYLWQSADIKKCPSPELVDLDLKSKNQNAAEKVPRAQFSHTTALTLSSEIVAKAKTELC